MGKNETVQEILHTAHRTRTGWRAECPFCAELGHRDRKTSLTILGDGRWWCYRGESAHPESKKGKLAEAPDPYADAQRVIDFTKQSKAKVFDPPYYFTELAGDDSEVFEPAREYLKSRSVSDEVIEKFGIGACYDGKWFGRIIVPIRKRGHKEWMGWVGRLWTKSPSKDAEGLAALKYLYPPGMSRDRIFFNSYAIRRETDVPAMLVEGAFDCFPFPEDAFAVLGKMSDIQLQMMKSNLRRPLAVVLDGDAWKDAWSLVVRMRFDNDMQSGIVGAVRLPPRTDPDEVPRKDLLKACKACLTDNTWGGIPL